VMDAFAESLHIIERFRAAEPASSRVETDANSLLS
jgi:hypothetical protein